MRAFTLVEIVITVALFSLLVIGVSELYVVFGRIAGKQNATIGVTLGASSILDTVRNAGSQAGHVVATHTFSGVVLNSGTSTALFELPAVNASGAIIANTYDYVGIYASSTTAYRIIDAAAGSARTTGKKSLTPMLDGLSFTYDNISFSSVASVIVDATTSAMVHGQLIQTHLRERIYLRNL